MSVIIGRRQLLNTGVAALSAALVARTGVLTAPVMPTLSIRVFDPTIPAARELAQSAGPWGAQVWALEGDPIRFWRQLPVSGARQISGFTRWSDFVLLRGLAAEQRMRVRHERDLSSTLGGSLFAWEIA